MNITPMLSNTVCNLAAALSDDSAIVDQIANKKLVTIEDIKTMNNAGITDDKIISLIKSTGSVYHLSSADVEDLQRAGVSKRVINYMLQTPYTAST